MVQETIKIQADVKDAVKKIAELTKAVEKLGNENAEQQKELTKALQDNANAGKKQVGVLKKVKVAVAKLGKGFKGLGLVFKGLGFGILIKLAGDLVEKFKENQIMTDALAQVSETLSIVLNQIVDVFKPIIERVSEATGGFDALGKVLGGALSIAVNIIVGAIQGIVLGVQKAQLAWEESFLGDGDPEEIKRLNEAIDDTSEKLAQTGERIKNAGKQIGDNFVQAVGEVGTLAQGIAEGVAVAVETIDVKSASSQAKRLVESKKNFELLALQQQRLVEKYDLQAEQQRQIRDDETLSIADRIKANEELGNVIEDQTEAEKNTIQQRINAIQTEIDLKGESIERTNELYDLNTELLAIDAKVAGFKSEQLINEIGLKKELIDLDKTKAESLNELAINEANFMAEQGNNELAKVQAKRDAFELEKELELERLQFNIDNTQKGTQARIDAETELATKQQEFGHQKIELDKLEAETKKALVQQGLDAVIQAAGAESGVGKALFVAKQALALKELIMNAKSTLSKATMNAAESGTDIAKGTGKAAASAPPPFNLIPIAIFAAQAVGIIASIRSAMSKTKAATSKFGAGGGGGGVPSAPSPVAATPPAFNIVGSSGSNQLADAIGGQTQQPIQAFVVSNDVTTAQSMERNIVENATL